MLFYSQLQGIPIVDAEGRRLARLRDLELSLRDGLPLVTGVVAKVWPNRKWLLPWDAVDKVDFDQLRLKSGISLLQYEPPTPATRLLTRDILDQQVVDVNGAKVVRVNDVQLAMVKDQLVVIGVDIGPWGLARRLALAEVLHAVARSFHFTVPEGLIRWDVVETLGKGASEVQLKVARDRLTRLHPADLADIFAELGYDQRSQLLSELDDAQVADVLEEMEPDEAADVLGELDSERAADVLEEMEPDEAADVLGELSERKAMHLIGLMDAEEAEEIRELLAHREDTAGAMMTPSFVQVRPEASVEAALAELKAQEEEVEVFTYVYLVDEDEHLLGVASLREMLVAEPTARMEELSPPTIYKVEVDDDPDEVLRVLMKYGLQAVPVVSQDQRLVGVVTLHDAITPLVPEHLR